MLIEEAELENLEEILVLQKLAYQSEAALYDAYDDMPPLTQTLDGIGKEFGKRLFLKAVIAGRIAGSVRAHIDDGACHIGRLIVHPSFQRRGVGTALMAEIESRFSAASRFVLFTGHKSERNIGLYQKLGYEIFKTERIRDGVENVFLQKAAKA